MEIFVPGTQAKEIALSSTTHLSVAAHHDDIEVMAYDGILKCFGSSSLNFTGVVVTNGAGSPRAGIYSGTTDAEMREIRKLEQKKAAFVGEYAAQVFLDRTSGEAKDINSDVWEEIARVITETQPEYIYTHNPADKHPSHVGVFLHTIKALRSLDYKPKGVYGCEVWRSLDWMADSDKVKFDVSGRSNLESALIGVFDSQISGGKRYDLATAGRRLANATYSESHSVDTSEALAFAMDLTPLIMDKSLDITAFVLKYISDFADDVKKNLAQG